MEVKSPRPTDWVQIDEFLNRNLRPNAQWSLKEEYPLAFSEKNIKNIHFIEDETRVLAHAVVHPTLIKTHHHLFKVGLIGSVVTEEDQRGQGLSSEIVQRCLQTCKEQNCELAMLWTDMFNFYAKFGFEVAGSEVALQAGVDFKAPIKENLKVLETNKVAPAALLKLYNHHFLRSVRKLSDIEKFLNIPNTEVYTAWNKLTNALEAYCVLGKGADFENYVHEWGGNVPSIMSLIQTIVQKKQTTITLICPPQSQNLIRQMQEFDAQKFFGVLGMFAITQPESFCKKIKKGARAQGYDQFIFEYQQGKYYFGYGDEIYCTDSDTDIIRLVFGPNTAEKIHSFSPNALEALKEIFPIPFWIWGWDSI